MKLIYAAQIGLFDDWAHTVQIMKMCEAFSENGLEVELVVPKRKNLKNLDPFVYNHTKKIFKITKLPYIDIFLGNSNPFFYWLRLVSFLVSAKTYLMFADFDILYTREIYAGLFFSNVIMERHSFPTNTRKIYKHILQKVSRIVVLTSFIKSKIVEIGIAQDKIIVCPDAVQLEDFSNIATIQKARTKLSLSTEDFLFGYIGTLKTMGMEKGVGCAIEALNHLPSNYKLYVVGGELYDIDYYKKIAESSLVSDRVIFAGRVLHKDVPLYISACDALVAPFPENEHYSYFMSPLKIFEYMASQRPIIASDLPSLREVLTDGETAILIPPSDAISLAKAIQTISVDNELAESLVKRAYDEVIKNYTWKIRAKNILNSLK
ncbi:glycosyltransferase family 4 protein [Patescibacteria group bacterium]|nr:glycosyltransferase family 4 protein [Patescibacteria group bacterium]